MTSAIGPNLDLLYGHILMDRNSIERGKTMKIAISESRQITIFHCFTWVLPYHLITKQAEKYDELSILYHFHNCPILMDYNEYIGLDNFFTTAICLEIHETHPFLYVYGARAQTPSRWNWWTISISHNLFVMFVAPKFLLERVVWICGVLNSWQYWLITLY